METTKKEFSNYTKIYDSIYQITDLNFMAKNILSRIAGFEQCYQSNQSLANYFQLGKSTIAKEISKLVKLGYITTSYDKRNYRICKATDKTKDIINSTLIYKEEMNDCVEEAIEQTEVIIKEVPVTENKCVVEKTKEEVVKSITTENLINEDNQIVIEEEIRYIPTLEELAEKYGEDFNPWTEQEVIEETFPTKKIEDMVKQMKDNGPDSLINSYTEEEIGDLFDIIKNRTTFDSITKDILHILAYGTTRIIN